MDKIIILTERNRNGKISKIEKEMSRDEINSIPREAMADFFHKIIDQQEYTLDCSEKYDGRIP